MPRRTVEELQDELEQSVAGSPAGVTAGAAAAPTPSACAAYRREQRLQFAFMAFYQALVAVLAAAALILLLLAAHQALRADANGVGAAAAAAGTIVAGAGGAFLTKQRAEGRRPLPAAAVGCSAAGVSRRSRRGRPAAVRRTA
ncbi:MAG: hypothetical protein LC789_14630 [Actinobacteria bacterium]|nr:hypothetical protein [Actinomycetota bacterium]